MSIGMITIVGHAGADAERGRAGDADVTRLRIAASDGSGERRATTWWAVDVFGRPGEWAAEIRTGEAVTVMGELCARTYTPRDGGEPRVALSIRAVSVVRHQRPEAAPAPSRAPAAPRGGDAW